MNQRVQEDDLNILERWALMNEEIPGERRNSKQKWRMTSLY